MAVVAIGRRIQQQAFIQAFGDTLFLLGAGLVIALLATLLLKRPQQPAIGGGH